MANSAAEKNAGRPDLSRLRAALEAGTMRQVQRMLATLHPAEIAHLLEALPPAERSVVWDLVADEDEGGVLVELNDEVRAKIVSDMNSAEVVAAAEGMDIDDLADFIADLPEAVTREVVLSLSHQDQLRLQAVMSYPEDSAGGLMDPNILSVRPDVSLEVVTRYLRMLGGMPDRTDALFVVDRHGHYIGMLYFSRLLTQDPQTSVAAVMDTAVAAFHAEQPASQVAQEFRNRDLVSAPVVDRNGLLVGRITVDDIVDVIQGQADHDILSMAGLDEDDDMFAPVVTSTRRRAIWLGVNLATAFLASAVVAMFQPAIDKVVMLAVLMPVVASMGGIAGSQTLTLMIRGMALGRVQPSNARWLLGKEVFVGVLNGFAWAVVVALISMLLFNTGPALGLIIAAAICINLLTAAFAGFGIPLALKRLDIDPALAGTVVLTTVTDVVGFIAFLGLGTLYLL